MSLSSSCHPLVVNKPHPHSCCGASLQRQCLYFILTSKVTRLSNNVSFLNLKRSLFYRRHYELVSKFNVGLKPLLHQGLSEPEFYGDLVYKLKKKKKK